MSSLLRRRVLPAILACFFVPLASGCGSNPNETKDADAKVVIPPNAPQSQEEYYKQQQALSKSSKARKGAR